MNIGRKLWSFNNAKGVNLENSEYLLRKGKSYLHYLQNFEEAENCFDQLINLDPQNRELNRPKERNQQYLTSIDKKG